jgi:hypothetical protein
MLRPKQFEASVFRPAYSDLLALHLKCSNVVVGLLFYATETIAITFLVTWNIGLSSHVNWSGSSFHVSTSDASSLTTWNSDISLYIIWNGEIGSNFLVCDVNIRATEYQPIVETCFQYL